MKKRLWSWAWKTVVVLVTVGAVGVILASRPDTGAQRAVAATRQSLREQGFKTDLADFDFSTSPELQAREAVLKNTEYGTSQEPFQDHPNLLEPIGKDSAVIVWKQDAVKKTSASRLDDSDSYSWSEFRGAISGNQAQLDAAYAAILAGPIRFNLDARGGNDIRLPHLAGMKKLAQTAGDETVLELHDGNRAAAWTNLLAETRLVTAWQVEPVEIVHLVRYACAGLAYNATWQALQGEGWTDDQLARLQTEWEGVDFFKDLPETVAFKRAGLVAMCQRTRDELPGGETTVGEFLQQAAHYPISTLSELKSYWDQGGYRRHGSYEDEKNLLLFYRDREVELRTTVQAPTWLQMRELPGVTNTAVFQSPYKSRLQIQMNLRQIAMQVQRRDVGLLARAAEAEARRRILITAIALERYHGKHGAYPPTLAELAPEFLKAAPVDFMDGRPLRYRVTGDGHFFLYSVGLDGVDNGGMMQTRQQRMQALRESRATGVAPEADIVWPRPPGSATLQEEEQVQADARKAAAKARELAAKRYLTDISDREWKDSPARQSRVAKILAMNWAVGADEPTFNGQSIEKLVGNEAVYGTNLSLPTLLKPTQIITGKEPEDMTFEFPIRYEAMTNDDNLLKVVVDADPEQQFPMDAGGNAYDRERATNGDYLFVWHTIYDPPGPHAVQAYFVLGDKREGNLYINGPPVAVTTSNLCQFSLDCANYDAAVGARFHARLPEKNGNFSIECVTTNGAHLTTLTGSTSNGEFNVVWNLVDDRGRRFPGGPFNSIVQLTLPDSGRTQTLKGP
ncbi:MAG: hypothetical protein P4N60_21055 [Verrucomicrobiae bacterium]|nr:hypothetical protein [Verrucomicrobiae bacterium]